MKRRDFLASAPAVALFIAADAAPNGRPQDPFIEICEAMRASMPRGYKLHSMTWSEAGEDWDHFAAAVPKGSAAGGKIYFDAVNMAWRA